ncbi:counting factor associated protein [Tieghemostelium lacteum]|uniref:Counting factor associated protein n=1 Tax=Tieghemostelium lacteum TaxID=361077 RepID=A0A152A0F9_TIELA|nr:counting factor associated protein [Tieghemostelium lacteum]|eukprot:KYQ99683.1 counting factor associated protein [Tieghemostelium lacteum]
MSYYIFILLLLFINGYQSIPSLSNPPPQYVLQGTFNIPYFNTSIPLLMVYDSVNNRQYYDYYNGIDININLWNSNVSYSIGPQVYHIGCETNYGPGQLEPILPENPEDWVYNSTSTVNNVDVIIYSYSELEYGKENYYQIAVDASSGDIVQYLINGENTIVIRSHPDIYVLDVTYFSTDITDYNYVWQVPSFLTCEASEDSWSGEPAQEKPKQKSHHLIGRHHSNEKKYLNHFSIFKDTHQKEYSSHQEHNERYQNFKNRLHFIMRHNHFQESSYKLGMNHFGDRTDEELRQMQPDMSGMMGEADDYIYAGVHVPKVPLSDLPASVDWRDKGCVAPVKDQGICGSCWAFGSSAALEAQNCIANGELIEISEQQLVDCSFQQGSQGCNGGSAYGVYQYVQENGGISTESGYPYTAAQQYCKLNHVSSGIQVSGYNRIQNGSESDLQDAVATIGPVAVAIDTGLYVNPAFYFYQSGIWENPSCSTWNVDHEVVVIGYGTMETEDYWLIKNSWSTHWGMNGYGLMARNKGDSCGIASDAVYPIPVFQN